MPYSCALQDKRHQTEIPRPGFKSRPLLGQLPKDSGLRSSSVKCTPWWLFSSRHSTVLRVTREGGPGGLPLRCHLGCIAGWAEGGSANTVSVSSLLRESLPSSKSVCCLAWNGTAFCL